MTGGGADLVLEAGEGSLAQGALVRPRNLALVHAESSLGDCIVDKSEQAHERGLSSDEGCRPGRERRSKEVEG